MYFKVNGACIIDRRGFLRRLGIGATAAPVVAAASIPAISSAVQDSETAQKPKPQKEKDGYDSQSRK